MIAGHQHPLNQFLKEAVDFFSALGFEIVEGEEIVSEWYNFDSLNVPAWHPSRDSQDTFWLKNKALLRTHTSAMQVKAMETRQPPVRIIVPGRCFRNEATDASHETTFHQLEGFVIDENISLAHLKGTLDDFINKIFGKNCARKFVPSYYPFTEPSMDAAIKIKDKWLEILGSGMIHPLILKNMKVDADRFSGFAFGMGIDRLVMLKYGINDIRWLYSGDLRFIKQF